MTGKIRRALISVTDKTGIESFAKSLSDRGIEIIASGGTAGIIRKAGIDVVGVSDLTGFPECMDGRVKTLHPKIHGGILADREKDAHLSQAKELEISLIDLVVVNLYRFREAVSDPALGEKEIVEQIDIGGPTLIRSAGKNYHSVAVVVDPSDYGEILRQLDKNDGTLPLDLRRGLASKAFHHTASYDAAISAFFDGLEPEGSLPGQITSVYTKINDLRYGENPHQPAGLYLSDNPKGEFHRFVQHQGKELSFNNIQDMWAAFLLSVDLGINSCAVLKHMNPCGAAVCDSVYESFIRARKTDPLSAFGSIVSVNGVVDEDLAAASKDGFVEVILAKGFTDSALEGLKKKKNLRLITVPEPEWERETGGWTSREAGDMLLVQRSDSGFPELDDMKYVTSRKPTDNEKKALILSWKIVKHLKSNGIVICDREGTVGVGAGQMSRIDSCRIAVDKARREGMEIAGTSAGSDAFFPFPDGVEQLAEAGVTSIIQPGGSIRDDEVIKAAEKLGIAMVITGRRHFRH
ncbi:MAG: bifunctional phosphoribosylaminoimidazolecarboxamide formyltransferase/IMP cyclohydrolase [Candidatus Krumholzibacteriota bacterium]|nr:bifunctional phosphoribosylaminoimidazolecarboxamide formyltransferase/IMP cyclohydrolase [Candidatus Krumholzibacteriota bacterium]